VGAQRRSDLGLLDRRQPDVRQVEEGVEIPSTPWRATQARSSASRSARIA
jgi:hypothetical protein